jgi:prevent-host-death family protein
MKIVATNDAKTNLSRYLKEVSEGETIVIARGSRPLAKLVPYQENSRIRPKVGEVMDEPLQIDDAVFRPMGREELEAWGL